ncbi:DUF982 domain-containing protein [Labrys neptuniae]|uniref:DUF982 domain-containing protein n=1 Tax=Labrys neptuniae TaxID=376174 RepID=UPI0028922959|nr:DUF982 domain-containing protein [Labrys neptuniae]MDT3377369.1 DUF982 domain-containing protein [Labrys neptuniae]
MSKASFERPVVFMLRPNLLQRVSNAAEASYFLLHRWQQAKGPAYLAARNACYLAALGRVSADDCRRAFALALAEAGMSDLDEFSDAEGVRPTEVGISTRLTFGQVQRSAPKNPSRAEKRISRAGKMGHVWFVTGTKACASSADLKELSRDLAISEAGRVLRPMRELQEARDRNLASI